QQWPSCLATQVTADQLPGQRDDLVHVTAEQDVIFTVHGQRAGRQRRRIEPPLHLVVDVAEVNRARLAKSDSARRIALTGRPVEGGDAGRAEPVAEDVVSAAGPR